MLPEISCKLPYCEHSFYAHFPPVSQTSRWTRSKQKSFQIVIPSSLFSYCIDEPYIKWKKRLLYSFLKRKEKVHPKLCFSFFSYQSAVNHLFSRRWKQGIYFVLSSLSTFCLFVYIIISLSIILIIINLVFEIWYNQIHECNLSIIQFINN